MTPITGYRDLSDSEVQMINEIKAVGAELSMLVLKVKALPDADQRWAAIGNTDFQTGLMALVRAVARPTNF